MVLRVYSVADTVCVLPPLTSSLILYLNSGGQKPSSNWLEKKKGSFGPKYLKSSETNCLQDWLDLGAPRMFLMPQQP